MEKIKDIPLIEKSKDIFGYGLLGGEFGKEVFNEYYSTVKSKYKNNRNLMFLNFKDGIVEGSNSYSVVILDNILSKYDLRTLNSTDVAKVMKNGGECLDNIYSDLGVVLRNEDVANEYLARQLSKQARDRKYEFSNSNPLVFKPCDLELILDSKSPCGLALRMREDATPFNAPELSSKNEGKEFNDVNKNGVPIFKKNGDKINYTRDNGLSRFNLVWGSYIDSEYVGLSGCLVQSRIIVINDGECMEGIK